MERGDAERPGQRRHAIALAIYALTTVVFLLTTARTRLTGHTEFNHFALLADAWTKGRLDLGGPPPSYAGNNDFAVFEGRTYVSFPPFPAVLILPVVALTGAVERVRDGLFFVSFAGVAPAMLFLALSKLARTGRSRRSDTENAALSLLFAFGTVYWFSAVQGTVWFAAHVVGTALLAIYIRCSLDAEYPALAGLSLALAFATRTPMGFAFPLFVAEALRAHRLGEAPLGRSLLRFGLPAAGVLGAVFWHNAARFGDPLEFGHHLLAIGWRARIDRYGLFSVHYLGRNLAVVLAGLPFFRTPGIPFQINAHGLALWITSPFLLFALMARRAPSLFGVVALTAACVAVPSLLYQNTGWIQFGYRFSNDFAPFLVLLVALSGRPLRSAFWAAGALAVVVNAFGALTFQRAGYERYYFVDRTQRVLFEPD